MDAYNEANLAVLREKAELADQRAEEVQRLQQQIIRMAATNNTLESELKALRKNAELLAVEDAWIRDGSSAYDFCGCGGKKKTCYEIIMTECLECGEEIRAFPDE